MKTETTHESIGQRRLREAREAAAALESTAPATADESAPLRLPRAGEQVHFLRSGKSIPRALPHEFIGEPSHITTRGETITITDRIIAAATDRHGGPGWLRYVFDEDAQLDRFGEVWVRPGAAPADLDPWTPGSPDWAAAREKARAEAWALPTEEARAEAVAAVRRRFGAAPVTSTVLNSAPDPSIPAAEAQQRRIAAAGVRQASTYAPSERGGYSEGRG